MENPINHDNIKKKTSSLLLTVYARYMHNVAECLEL